MTFNQELFNVITNEESITSLVAGINFHHLPDNFTRDKDYLIYDSNIAEALNTLDNFNYGDDYSLRLKTVSKNPQTIYEIGQAIKDFFKVYTSTNFRSVTFERDVYVYSEEDSVHILSMDFTVDFCNG